MKPAFVFSCLLLPALLFARQATRTKTVTVETEHRHTGASHQSTRTNSTATERHSTASWHYHSGQKRPQVKVEESGERAEDRNPSATDSTRK